MIKYGLYNEIEYDIAETPSLETFMHIISEIPEDEIWSYGVYEVDRDDLSYDELVRLQISLDEWLHDFIGRPF